MPLRLSCLAPWSGIYNISHSNLLINQNIITTYPTESVWSTHICPVFPTFIGSPLRCSQISDHHSCLATLLWTCQICHSDNSSANPSLRRAFMLNLGPLCPLWVSASISVPPSGPSPMNFFKSLSPLFHGLLTPESRTVTLIHQFLTLVARWWDT